jgi:hypothetical protein
MTPLIMGHDHGPRLQRADWNARTWHVPLIFWATPQMVTDLMFFQSDPNPDLPHNISYSMLEPLRVGLEGEIRARMDRVNCKSTLLQMNVWGADTGDVQEFRIVMAVGHQTFRLWTAKELRRHKLNVMLARMLNALPLWLRSWGIAETPTRG